jgi:hypothetical protein
MNDLDRDMMVPKSTTQPNALFVTLCFVFGHLSTEFIIDYFLISVFKLSGKKNTEILLFATMAIEVAASVGAWVVIIWGLKIALHKHRRLGPKAWLLSLVLGVSYSVSRNLIWLGFIFTKLHFPTWLDWLMAILLPFVASAVLATNGTVSSTASLEDPTIQK